MRYPQGRLLFPAISAFSLLLAYGVVQWLPLRWRGAAPWLVAVLLAMEVFADDWHYLRRRYADTSAGDAHARA